MADVLLLCVHADAQRAVVLAEELEIAGFSVEGASAGRAALESCAAVVLVCTKDALESGLFLDAAQSAALTGKVIVANFTGAPHPWRRASNIDMSRWDGDPENVAVDVLINDVMRRTARKRRAPADFAQCYVAMRHDTPAEDAEDNPPTPAFAFVASREPAPVLELTAADAEPFHAETSQFGAPAPARPQWRGRAALSAVVAAAVMLAGSFLGAPNSPERFAAAAYAQPLSAPMPAAEAISFEDALATTPLDLTPTEAPTSVPRYGREPAAAPRVAPPAPLRAAPVIANAPRVTAISAVVTPAAPARAPAQSESELLNQREAARLHALYETPDPAI